MLKLTTDKHEASRGLSATAELLVTLHHITAKFIGRNVWTELQKVLKSKTVAMHIAESAQHQCHVIRSSGDL